mmetsp:Transcript_46472/g.149802  ORF Transcript_46472/g.149802 Transcript_46472/m.149802 type:complete len:333 (-) Transcript_46472:47-1045(-)
MLVLLVRLRATALRLDDARLVGARGPLRRPVDALELAVGVVPRRGRLLAKGAQHLLLHLRHGAEQHQRVEGRPKVHRAQLAQRAVHAHLALRPHARHPNRARRRAHARARPCRGYLEHLADGLADRHEARRQVDWPAARERRQRRLACLDVDQQQRVQPERRVRLELVKEGGGLPAVGEEGHRDGLAEAVQLDAAAADRVHDGGVVNHPRLHAERLCTREDVAVGGRAERVAHDEQRDLGRAGALEDRLDGRLHKVALGHRHRPAVERLEPGDGDGEHRGVRLQVDLLAAADDLEPAERDVVLVVEAKADEVEHGCGGTSARGREFGGTRRH